MLTFGELDSGFWGVAWDLGPDTPGFGFLGESHAVLTGEWRIEGDGGELESLAVGERSEVGDGFDELVAVRGRARIDGTERSIDCLGRRGMRAVDPIALDSIRDVSAWFGPDDGVALTAARPPKFAGQQDDQLTASFFEGGRPLPIADPRLSTTYGADGSPIHAGIELWVEAPAEQEDAEQTASYPRRAAGEATGTGAEAATDSLDVGACLFRWHAHGREGAGVYVLARPR
jgi:hypothetical protein